VGAQGSCYPHRENFLDLDPDYTDDFGLPLLRMTFDIRDNEIRMSNWVTQRIGEICKAMGADPGSSVVSPHLQHWSADNLFVVGASVYPHNSGYNPTGPLAALALRLGDDLLRYISRPTRL
jgi:gluconate 2-dehydrogenase alpha chain